MATRFHELAQQEKWFEIQDELFAENVRSIEPPNARLPNAQGKAAVRKKGESLVSQVAAVHKSFTTAPVVGQSESVWVSEQLGWPIVKAWNSIGSDSFARKGEPAGSPDRIAIPVAADRERDREVAMRLVEDTGLDAIDAGTLADSWRQQPGAPAYCTDLTCDALSSALAAAERWRLSKRRELALAVVMERLGDGARNPGADYSVRVNRALFM